MGKGNIYCRRKLIYRRIYQSKRLLNIFFLNNVSLQSTPPAVAADFLKILFKIQQWAVFFPFVSMHACMHNIHLLHSLTDWPVISHFWVELWGPFWLFIFCSLFRRKRAQHIYAKKNCAHFNLQKKKNLCNELFFPIRLQIGADFLRLSSRFLFLLDAVFWF